MFNPRVPSSQSITVTETRIFCGNLNATLHLASKLARHLRAGDIIRLEGDLGTGKSEIARAMIREWAGPAFEVPSPTFTIVQHYPLAGLLILHADLYRLTDPDELIELGLDDLLDQSALLVEWPELAEDRLPGRGLRIKLSEHDDAPDARYLSLLALDRRWAGILATLKDH